MPTRSTPSSRDKFGRDGIYNDDALFDRIYKDDFGARYLKEASDYAADVIECTRDICTYIYETHGRFPAHCRGDPRPRRLAAGPPRGRALLRALLPRRTDRRTPRTRPPVARVAPAPERTIHDQDRNSGHDHRPGV